MITTEVQIPREKVYQGKDYQGLDLQEGVPLQPGHESCRKNQAGGNSRNLQTPTCKGKAYSPPGSIS